MTAKNMSITALICGIVGTLLARLSLMWDMLLRWRQSLV